MQGIPFLMASIPMLLAGARAGGGLSASSGMRVLARHGKSLRGTVGGVPLLVLRGTHRERGVARGILAGREIVRMLDEAVLPAIESQQPGLWSRHNVPSSKSFRLDERHEQELEGMLEGLRQALPQAADRMLTTLGREIAVDDLRAVQHLGERVGCSSFTAWGPLTADGQPVTGRNLDYHTLFPVSPYLGVVAVEPAEEGLKATIDISGAISVGAATAMNADGVFVAVHDVPRGPDCAPPFQVRPMGIRNGVEAADAASAVEGVAAALRRLPPAMGSNMHVSAPAVGEAAPDVAVLEWDGRLEGQGVTVRRATDGRPFLVCTNHHLLRPVEPEDDDREWSETRYSRLTEALQAHLDAGRTLDLSEAVRLLDSVSANGESVTWYSAIVWPAERRFAFSISPSDGVSATRGRWVEFTWDGVFAAQ
jgi:hypothetical protein